MKKYELLSPAGSMEAFKAAISAQADAIYLGGTKFGARSYAQNFSNQELIELIKYAHFYKKKVYVTVNTVIFQDEIEEVLKFIAFLNENHFDAVIVQDLGLIQLIVEKYPTLEVHASTQMNITSLEQVVKLKELGVKRVVLARETPLSEIKRIKENIDMELEVFVHGALCVAYSGNCYMSSFICKRSGNRGKCAGSCRLEYSLDGGKTFKYYLSTKDLYTLDNLNQLLEIGVDSFKIEGRMKRKEYVAQIVSSYRKAIDHYINQSFFDENKEKRNIELIYNRKFTKGFLFNEKNNSLINSDSPNHIGVLVGKVINSYSNKILVSLTSDINQNDALRIVGKNEDAIIVNQVKVNNRLVNKAISGDLVEIRTHEMIKLPALVYKTTDALQIDSLNSLNVDKVPLEASVYLIPNKEKFSLAYEIYDGISRVCKTTNEIEPAVNSVNQRIYEQFQKTGPLFETVKLNKGLDKDIYLKISTINSLKRSVLGELKKIREGYYTQNYSQSIYQLSVSNIKMWERKSPHLSCRIRTEDQLQACIEMQIPAIYICDMNLYNKYRHMDNIFYYPPRVNNCQYNKHLIVNSIDKSQDNYIGVYANVTNAYTLRMYTLMGARQIGLSVELSYEKLSLLLKTYKDLYGALPNIEYMVYGRIEMMVSKYCLVNDFCKKNNLSCNECLKKQYYLTDRNNYAFPLVRDENCNMKVLNSKILHLVNYLDRIKQLGVNSFLLDFQLEDYLQVKEVINNYYCSLNKQKYDKINIEGITLGHFLEGVL